MYKLQIHVYCNKYYIAICGVVADYEIVFDVSFFFTGKQCASKLKKEIATYLFWHGANAA